MSGPDGSSIKRNTRCAAEQPERSNLSERRPEACFVKDRCAQSFRTGASMVPRSFFHRLSSFGANRMEDLSVFDIIGPRMTGPSSSHTAGAVRLSHIARKIAGGGRRRARDYPLRLVCRDGKGHGTDKALVAGALGMDPGRPRIKRSVSTLPASRASPFPLNSRTSRRASEYRAHRHHRLRRACDGRAGERSAAATS